MDYFKDLFFSKIGSIPKYTRCIHNEPLYYGIQFNYHGGLRLRVGKRREHKVTGCYAFLTYPGEVFEYGPIGDQPRHHNFICTYGPRIKQYLESGLFECNPESPLVHIVNGEKFYRTMYEVMTLCRAPQAVSPRAVLLFEDLLLQMHESIHEENRGEPFQSGYLTLINQIYAEPEKDWDFVQEARKYHVTQTHFRRVFKSLTGLPPQQFLLQNRLRKAAHLLTASKESIKEIAFQTGWNNVFYFSRIFRQKYQASPMQYRKEFLPEAEE